ncbi:MAG: hypothetical protein WDW36_001689 [Sanguina aurantia]
MRAKTMRLHQHTAAVAVGARRAWYKTSRRTRKHCVLTVDLNMDEPAGSQPLFGEFPYEAGDVRQPREFWVEAEGINQRCYVRATAMRASDIRPSHAAAEQLAAARPPASAFKVRWPIVKFHNLTTSKFAVLIKSHVDWHARH